MRRLVVKIMKITGFRFSKDFRRAESGWRKFVYDHVDVIGLNIEAGLFND